MDGTKQVADFMRGHHNPGIGSAVLDESNAADLGEASVANTGTADVCVACRGSAHPSSLPSGHVQPGEGYHHVVDWQGRPGQEICQLLGGNISGRAHVGSLK